MTQSDFEREDRIWVDYQRVMDWEMIKAVPSNVDVPGFSWDPDFWNELHK